jgi:5-methyltetrahydrofolate--homocysteine methyltransferase
MDLDILKQAVVDMKEDEVLGLVNKALQKNVAPKDILEHGLIPGMKRVGELFKQKEYYVPEVLLASEAFYAGFDIIQPMLKSETAQKKGRVVIGVVHGDIHDIGKNIVKVLVEAAGYRVIDLGNDVPLERFVSTVRKEQPDILALSSLMTTTMTVMQKILQELEKQNLRKQVKVLIGGAPVTEKYAKKIGADAYGEDAAAAVTLIESLLSE